MSGRSRLAKARMAPQQQRVGVPPPLVVPVKAPEVPSTPAPAPPVSTEEVSTPIEQQEQHEEEQELIVEEKVIDHINDNIGGGGDGGSGGGDKKDDDDDDDKKDNNDNTTIINDDKKEEKEEEKIVEEKKVVTLPKTIYSKALLKEAKELETKLEIFQKAIQPALAEYKEMLSISHQKFIRNITNVVQKIDKSLVEKVVTQDNKCFDSVCSKLESSCVETFNNIIKEKNDSANLIDAAVTIQKYYRGYKTRKEFNKKKKQLFLRDKAAKELLSTEKTYLSSLETMMTEYMQPLNILSKDPRSFISPEATETIFGNVLTVYGFSAQFLPMIEARMKRWSVTTTKLSDLYKHIENGKKVYQEYIAHFDKSANVLSSCLRNYEFNKWHEEVCHKQNLNGMRLNSFLIMPVQRMPRYELLLRELISHTPDDHPDLTALKSAYDNLKEVSKSINEFKRSAEQKVRLMEIQADLRTTCPDLAQPYRKYVDEVEVGVIVKKALKKHTLLLLNDQVMIVKCNNSQKIVKLWCQLYLFNISATITQDYEDIHTDSGPSIIGFGDTLTSMDFNFGVRLQSKAETCVVYFATEKARDEWIIKLSQEKSVLRDTLPTFNLTKDEENVITESAISMSETSGSQIILGGNSGNSGAGGGGNGGGGNSVSMSFVSGVSSFLGGSAANLPQPSMIVSATPAAPVIKDILDLYENVVKIQDEIMQNPIDLRTLFPEYCKGMNPNLRDRLKQRIDQLNIKLNVMYQLDQKARELLRVGHGSIPVQKVNQFIMEGIKPIDAMKTFIVTAYKDFPPGMKDDPRMTIRLVLKWYLDLTDSWAKFTTADLSN